MKILYSLIQLQLLTSCWAHWERESLFDQEMSLMSCWAHTWNHHVRREKILQSDVSTAFRTKGMMNSAKAKASGVRNTAARPRYVYRRFSAELVQLPARSRSCHMRLITATPDPQHTHTRVNTVYLFKTSTSLSQLTVPIQSFFNHLRKLSKKYSGKCHNWISIL